MEHSNSGGSQARPRAKMNYACEACRSSKVKCLAGLQPGICKRYGVATFPFYAHPYIILESLEN